MNANSSTDFLLTCPKHLTNWHFTSPRPQAQLTFSVYSRQHETRLAFDCSANDIRMTTKFTSGDETLARHKILAVDCKWRTIMDPFCEVKRETRRIVIRLRFVGSLLLWDSGVEETVGKSYTRIWMNEKMSFWETDDSSFGESLLLIFTYSPCNLSSSFSREIDKIFIKALMNESSKFLSQSRQSFCQKLIKAFVTKSSKSCVRKSSKFLSKNHQSFCQ